MKLMKFFSFLILIITCCTTYVHENKYIFIGQNGNEESAKTAFVLEVSAQGADGVFVMNGTGEVKLPTKNRTTNSLLLGRYSN